MGFLATYMKQSLIRTIDFKKARLTFITRKYLYISSQIGALQGAQSGAQAGAQQMLGQIGSIFNAGFQSQMAASQQYLNNMNAKYNKAIKDSDPDKFENPEDDPAVKEAKKNWEQAQQGGQTKYTEMMQQNQAFQFQLAAANQATNSIFNKIQENDLKVLQEEQRRITDEKASLESELQDLTPMLASYEKLETDEAKRMAPNFGLSA